MRPFSTVGFCSGSQLRRTSVLAASALCALLCGCGPAAEPPPTFHPSTPQEAAALSYFNTAVKPVFRENCNRCHFGLNHKGGFNLSTREQLLKGGKSGVDVVPGRPEQSRLVVAIHRGHGGPEMGGEQPKPMPPKESLSDEEIAAIEKWIANGAVMDR